MSIIRYLSIGMLFAPSACSNQQQEESTATKPSIQERQTLSQETAAEASNKSFNPENYKHGMEAQPMIDEAAPSFELKALNGKSYNLSQFKGKYVVIQFMATWCPFSNAAAPYLEPLYNKYKDKGVQVLMINVKEPEEVVNKMAGRHRFSFPVLLDKTGKTAAKYAPDQIMPELTKRYEIPIASSLIIDREGNIRFYQLLDTDNFDETLNELKYTLNTLIKSE